MDFKSYIQNKIAMQGLNNSFGKLTLGNLDTEKFRNISLFSSISAEELQNMDWSKLLSDMAALSTDSAALSGENQILAEVVNELMSLEGVSGFADVDGNGEINDQEIANFVQSMMSEDGDASAFTYEDIDKALEKMGINLADAADTAIAEALKDEEIPEEEKTDKAKETDKEEKDKKVKDKSKSESASKTNGAGGAGGSGGVGGGYSGSGVGGGSGVSGSSQSQQKQVTAADELEDLEKQRKQIISDADKEISSKEKEKDDLVNNNSKISDDLKKEYKTAKDSLKETNDAIKDKETAISDGESDLSGVEQEINALEGEKSTLKTDSDDKDINKQNKERLGEIESKISKQNEKKAKLEQKINKNKEELKTLEAKQKEQEKALADVEKKLGEADPELKTKLDKVNKELSEVKNKKSSDVKDIDSKIEAKRKEANKEAKQAGENKGKAANDIGSGLVALAEKYMGKNEADGSYKMFTNGRTEAWCADFVTYIVKEYAQQQGLDIKSGFGSPAVAGLMQWAQNNNAFTSVSGMGANDRQNLLKNDLKPGDVIIWKSNGASHTGIIRKINGDGTFETVEGNSSDQVKSNHKSINDSHLTGFIKFSDIVK